MRRSQCCPGEAGDHRRQIVAAVEAIFELGEAARCVLAARRAKCRRDRRTRRSFTRWALPSRVSTATTNGTLPGLPRPRLLTAQIGIIHLDATLAALAIELVLGGTALMRV